MKYQGDEDEEKDSVLKMLNGEVDDFAGSQLKDPDAKEINAGGATITITVTPNGQEEKAEGIEGDEGGGEGHDPIAHILGMCGGGCTK